MPIAIDTETHAELKRQLEQAEVDAQELMIENERMRAALKDIAIGEGENVLDAEGMRARAFDALQSF